MLARDWRAGELRVLAMALVIAVASVTSVAFFADRVGQALARDAHQLLGADLVLVVRPPLEEHRSRRTSARTACSAPRPSTSSAWRSPAARASSPASRR